LAKKLTDIAIRNMKPSPARREIPDGGNGLYLVLQPSGARSFALRFRRDGRPTKFTLGTWFGGNAQEAPEPKIGGALMLAGARKLAAEVAIQIGKGADPVTSRRQAKEEQERRREDTFRSVAERYMKREAGMKFDANGIPSFDESKLRTGHERWLMLQRSIFPTLGSRPIAEIKKSDIIRLLDKIADGELKDQNGRKIKGGNVAADRALAVIRKIFSWHASREDDFRSPIVPGLNRVKASEQVRGRVLSDQELRAIWKTASQLEGPYPAFVKFLLLTGARRSEAARMRWAEVDDAGDWLLPAEAGVGRNKVKRDLVRPLSQAAQAVLAGQPRFAGCEFVFTTNGRSPISGYWKLKKRFDLCVVKELRKQDPKAEALANWWQHDLRRTARTLMSRAGVSPHHAERCVGHVLRGVEGVYDQHKYHVEMKKAYEALAAMIEHITNPPADDNVVTFPQPVAENV
jgi:integrase